MKNNHQESNMAETGRRHRRTPCLLLGIYLVLLLLDNGSNFASAWSPSRILRTRSRHSRLLRGSTVVEAAVTDSDFELGGQKKRTTPAKKKEKKTKKEEKTKYPESSVVSRIARAVSRAADQVDAKQQSPAPTEPEDASPPAHSTFPPSPKLASLTQLTKAIDKQLLAASVPPRNPSRLVARDSMAAVVNYNYQQKAIDQHREIFTTQARKYVTKHVAMVFSKPLLDDDQISIDYACRIRRLVRAMQQEDYKPDVLCFVRGDGQTNSTTFRMKKNRSIVSTDVGYIFFRHLCAAQGVSLSTISHIYLDDPEERSSGNGDEYDALQSAVRFLQNDECIPSWHIDRLRVQLSLFSSDYHLCQLHDSYTRSPDQSPLRALHRRNWVFNTKSSTGVLETRWTFVYSTPGPALAKNAVQLFFLKFFQTSQQLRTVVLNLRGVVDEHEFFQQENYLVLVSARRSLVTDMEEIYRIAPSLKFVNRLLSSEVPGKAVRTKPVDVVLESALLSLGRCLDLVRPAGLFTGIVPARDWKLALHILHDAVEQISAICNPDQPLPHSEWGRMADDDDDSCLGNHDIKEEEEDDDDDDEADEIELDVVNKELDESIKSVEQDD
jgi:hypothetical protein